MGEQHETAQGEDPRDVEHLLPQLNHHPHVHRDDPRRVNRQSVDRARAQLMGRGDPTDAAAAARVAVRRLPSIYPQGVIRPIDARLRHVVTNGSRFFLQGATVGVGVSRLLTGYANAFNQSAHTAGDPRRIAYVQLTRGCTSIPKFLDALALALRASLSTTEIRFRSSAVLARRIIATARLHGVAVIMIDHVGKAADPVRSMLGDLLRATDPEYTVHWESGEVDSAPWKVGVVLADVAPPETLFRNSPDVLLALDGGTETLQPYTDLSHFAEAVRVADIGLEDFDLNRADDAAMAEELATLTDGLVSRLYPLLQLTDLVARTNGYSRPDLACIDAAADVLPKLVHRTSSPNPFLPGETIHQVRARANYDPARLNKDEEEAQEEDPDDDEQPKARKSRSEILREKRQKRYLAQAELRDMSRRTYRGG